MERSATNRLYPSEPWHGKAGDSHALPSFLLSPKPQEQTSFSIVYPSSVGYPCRRQCLTPAYAAPFVNSAAPASTTTAALSPSASSFLLPAGAVTPRRIRVAVVGGGPSGACAAEALAEASESIEVFLIERKMDNAKPCGGAIPICMMDDFDLPEDIVDRKVHKVAIISPTDREKSMSLSLPHEWVGMTRREILDGYLRRRAVAKGAVAIEGLVTALRLPAWQSQGGGKFKPTEEVDSDPLRRRYVVEYMDYGNSPKPGVGVKSELAVDMVIGADGANSRVVRAIGAGEVNYAMAFQERIKLPPEKMKFYEDRAEMYVGDDVSPDFYAWVFPKHDHVGVGTGTIIDRPNIKKYQEGIRKRAVARLEGGEVIKVEAHPIPDCYRPHRVLGRVCLVGDAAGYVTKCAGEGIYFAAMSGRMAGRAITNFLRRHGRLPNQEDLEKDYLRPYDKRFKPTYTAMDVLQTLFFRSNWTREAFTELCGLRYVQHVTFASYLYKQLRGQNYLGDLKMSVQTVAAFAREWAKHMISGRPEGVVDNPIERKKRLGYKVPV
eukprot:GHVT01047697.1.p1 GENE.GHVT01047697.1~~GHVT01047697.1.p1  ORF type:complete len:549 (-),score=65.02 GHVT01047697.1:918-2564(-)